MEQEVHPWHIQTSLTMPTATSAIGHVLSNLGPLTETFTAPASCATLQDKVQIALATQPEGNQFVPECKVWTYGDCYPSGSAIDSGLASLDWENPAKGFTIDYFSPGIVCPTGWTTAGVATKSEGGSITSSGPAFVLPTTESIGSRFHIYVNPTPNILIGAMDPEETAVLCCPRSVSPDRSDGSVPS